MAPPALPADLVDMNTPAYRCECGASCPCVLLSVMEDSYLVIGTTMDHGGEVVVRTRVAENETLTRLPRRLVEEAIINSIAQKQSALVIALTILQLLRALIVRPSRNLGRALDLAVSSVHGVWRRPEARNAIPLE